MLNLIMGVTALILAVAVLGTITGYLIRDTWVQNHAS